MISVSIPTFLFSAQGDLLEINAAGLEMLKGSSSHRATYSFEMLFLADCDYDHLYRSLHTGCPVKQRTLIFKGVRDISSKEYSALLILIPVQRSSFGNMLVLLEGEKAAPKDTENSSQRRINNDSISSVQLRTITQLLSSFHNIFSLISGYADLVAESTTHVDEIQGQLQEIRMACGRGSTVLQKIGLLNTSRPDIPVLVRVDQFFDELMVTLRSALPESVILKAAKHPAHEHVLIDPLGFEQIIMLLANSLVFAVSGERIGVHCSLITNGPEGVDRSFSRRSKVTIQLSVFDEDDLECGPISAHRFEVTEIQQVLQVAQMKLVSMNPDHDIVFEPENWTIVFHLMAATGDDVTLPLCSPLPRGAGQGILVIDDEQQLVVTMVRRLQKLGYAPVGETDPQAALALFQKRPDDFAVIILDQVMPYITGLELAPQLLSLKPSIPIIMTTGYSSGITQKQCKQKGISLLAMKPLDNRELALLIQEALNK